MFQPETKELKPRAAGIGRGALLVLILASVCGLMSLSVGCQFNNVESARRAARIASFGTQPLVKVRKRDETTPLGPIRRLVAGRSQPSDRTIIYLRKNNWLERFETDPGGTVKLLSQDNRGEPNMESVHAIAELSQLEADWNQRINQSNTAAQFYATAVIHAYQFLFDPKLNIQRNAYDPQFREICDIYNSSLENLLRLVCESSDFQPGATHFVGDDSFGVEFEVELVGRWKDEEFAKFELANDFEVEGIDNSYHTYGLGVPLIAIRKPSSESQSPFEKYYPPSLALPMTAFCEVQTFHEGDDPRNLKAVLKLFDPLEQTVVKSEARNAPLESDFTVPLAYYLNDPLLNTDVLSTVSLLDADIASEYFGFYMLEPYDPEKIPVVMVHGLWSNPVTWLRMFNDLRANQWIRDKYQFWFYMYPTGQPFWFSAQQMREDMATLRRDVDPQNTSPNMKEMILVGHSMGGLISRMQTVDSGNDFWEIISDADIEEVQGDPQTIAQIRELFFFESNPAVQSVITIGSPHRGSRYANNVTRWLSHRVFRLPKMLTANYDDFVMENRGILKNTQHLTVPTSIDSLSPESPFIQRLYAAESKVVVHNIYGNVAHSRLAETIGYAADGDGVVSIANAQLPGVVSNKEIPAEHMEIHFHPECILEVKRILLNNLVLAQKRVEPEEAGSVRQVAHEAATAREAK